MTERCPKCLREVLDNESRAWRCRKCGCVWCEIAVEALRDGS